ncbi:MAG TPA: PAS domain-containing protein, partial [Chthoniobacteraceae bacterium]|nr:PAS domain-containing protein [Chthoniobacteraceae bacterium]
MVLLQMQSDAARERYVRLYHYSPVGHLILTPGGRVTDINVAAAQLFGRAAGQIIGQPLALFLAPGAIQKLLENLRIARG